MNNCNERVASQLNNLLKSVEISLSESTTIKINGDDPVVDSPWRIGEASATALASIGAAISKIWDIRNDSPQYQTVEIDTDIAAASTYRCMYMKQNGYSIPFPDIEYPTVGLYPTKDGYVFINGGFPGLRRGILKLLNCADNKDAVEKALKKWNALELEKEMQKRGLCCVVCRSESEWKNSEHGKVLYEDRFSNGFINPVVIEKLTDTDPEPFPALRDSTRPLTGVRVLDFTHVLAGPTCGMMFAEQDADVIRINGPQIPTILPFVMDTGHGKLNSQLDLKTEDDKQKLWELLRDGCDILSDSFRPGSLANLGISPTAIAEELRKQNRGIIYVSINCYGHTGPWKDYPGWEQLAQTGCGLTLGMGDEKAPTLLPTFPNDYITGYFAALGALSALIKRAEEGGSYHVKVSLCTTAMWLQSFGKVDTALLQQQKHEINQDRINDMIIENPNTGYGAMSYFGHPIKYSKTKACWKKPTVPIGFNKPEWSYF